PRDGERIRMACNQRRKIRVHEGPALLARGDAEVLFGIHVQTESRATHSAERPSARAMPCLPLACVSTPEGEVAETSAGAQRRRASRRRRGSYKKRWTVP